MQEHNTIIGKLLTGINRKKFKRIADKYDGDKYVKYFNCWSQLVCILIGQIGKLKTKIFKDGRHNLYAGKILRRVIVPRENRSPLILVTNDLKRSSSEIAELYKQRWEIELFFKWIKQNLKIKKFLGKSENAVKTQICIALILYILLCMEKELKEICKNISMKNLLKIIGNNMFYTLKPINYGRKKYKNPNQLQFQWNTA